MSGQLLLHCISVGPVLCVVIITKSCMVRRVSIRVTVTALTTATTTTTHPYHHHYHYSPLPPPLPLLTPTTTTTHPYHHQHNSPSVWYITLSIPTGNCCDQVLYVVEYLRGGMDDQLDEELAEPQPGGHGFDGPGGHFNGRYLHMTMNSLNPLS